MSNVLTIRYGISEMGAKRNHRASLAEGLLERRVTDPVSGAEVRGPNPEGYGATVEEAVAALLTQLTDEEREQFSPAISRELATASGVARSSDELTARGA